MSNTTRDAIRARLRAEINAAAAEKVKEDDVLVRAKLGLHKHERLERQRKLELRKERLEKATEPKVCLCSWRQPESAEPSPVRCAVVCPQNTKPHLVPKWLRHDRKVVKSNLSIENGDCNLVCPVCNEYVICCVRNVKCSSIVFTRS